MIKASILSALFAILVGWCLSVAARSHANFGRILRSDVNSKDSSVETEGDSNSMNERIFTLSKKYGTYVCWTRPVKGRDHMGSELPVPFGTARHHPQEKNRSRVVPYSLHQVDSVAQLIPSIRRRAKYAGVIVKTRGGAATRSTSSTRPASITVFATREMTR